MIILGHDYFKHTPFYDVRTIDAILKTPPNSTLYMPYLKELHEVIEHAKLNHIPFALSVKTVREALFAHNFGASFIIVSRIMAPSIQKIADHYLFDAKVLASINSEEEIEELANLGIDGVIFSQGIVKVI